MSFYNIKKILVPVDLSEISLNALDTAVALAKKHNAVVQVLYVIEIKPGSFEDSGFQSNNYLTNSSDVLTALAGAIQHANDIKPILLQEEGNVTDTIIKTSLQQHSDVIIMGTHGASGYRDGFIGTNTYSVIKNSSCPVLTVPPKRKYLSFKKILFPIRPVSGALMRYDVVCQFIAPQALINVLGLSYRSMERETNVLDKIIDEIKDKLEMDNVKANAIWNSGNSIADDVLTQSQQTAAELIVITSVLDVTTKPNFIGPHTQKILHCSKVPVLNIKKLSVPMLA
jgi:nucleotide-binding universal stress UspA family protein